MSDPSREVEEHLMELRARGEVLDVERARASLASLIDELAAPKSPSRAELAAATSEASGLHLDTVRKGLEIALAPWSGDAFLAWLDETLGDGSRRTARGFPVASVLLAGSIPSANLLSLILPLALGTPVLARAGRHDPTTLPFLQRRLLEIDAALAGCLTAVDFDHRDDEALGAFIQAECVVATGSDETLRKIASRVPPTSRFVPHGHRLSVAVLALEPGGDEMQRALENLALDVALWDQLGCLSPVAAYVASSSHEIPEEVENPLVQAFEDISVQWPRGVLPRDAAASFAQERDGTELRAASMSQVRLRGGDGFALAFESDTRWRPAPLHRFLRVHPVRDPKALAEALAPLSPHLAAVGAELGRGPKAALWKAAIESAAPSRICQLGQMQGPPLSWSHDGRDPVESLVRWVDREV